jgi:hypothetical protein
MCKRLAKPKYLQDNFSGICKRNGGFTVSMTCTDRIEHRKKNSTLDYSSLTNTIGITIFSIHLNKLNLAVLLKV